MHHSALDTLNTFTLETLPNLDTAVLGALELFQKETLPVINIPHSRSLVVGSGNAEVTGRILFSEHDAVFASESDYEKKLERCSADGVIIVSSSGSKHAPVIARSLRRDRRHVVLITNTPSSDVLKELSEGTEYVEYVFPKNREPYTYNVSTYLGMILGRTKESPHTISEFLTTTVQNLRWPDLARYSKFYFIIPPQFREMRRMFEIKCMELFGREIARDIETSEYVKHATTVVPSDELFISFGEENLSWGNPKHRLHVPLPQDADYGALMALGYYVLGQIQKAHPPYFKDNIEHYTRKISEVFGTVITPIVE